MTTRRRSIRSPLSVAAALLLAAPILAGCSMIPVNDIVDQATGGTVDLGGTEVPTDFPSSVPLYEGEVLNGMRVGGDGAKVWNVGIRVPDAAALDTIITQLSDAGFSAQLQGPSSADGGTVAATGSNLGILVAVVADGGGFVANYTVTSG